MSYEATDNSITPRKDRQIGIGRNSKPRAALNSPSGAVIANRQSWLISASTSTTTSSMNDLLRRLASIVSLDADPDNRKAGSTLLACPDFSGGSTRNVWLVINDDFRPAA